MNNPTKENILSPSAYKHLPSARKAMLALEERRNQLKAVFLKKKYRYLDGTYVLLHAMIGFNKIIMWGGELPLILLTDYFSAFFYNYYDNNLGPAVIDQGNTSDLHLSQNYNGRSQLGDATHITYSRNWSSDVIGNQYSHLGNVNAYEMTLFDYDNDIYGRVGDDIGRLASIEDIFSREHSHSFGSLFGLAAHKNTPAWNLFRGLILYTLNVANKVVNDSWYWTPSFFVVDYKDPYFLKPGWYYGKYPVPDYDQDNKLGSLKVSFLGIVDSRANGSDFNYGWCEVVTEVEGVKKCDMNFYFQQDALSIPPNQTSYVEVSYALLAHSTIIIGSALTGFEKTLEFNDPFGELLIPDVSMWSFFTYSGSAVCIALISGERAKFYKYTGAAFLVYETEFYHSHSSSHDGKTLAIFESSNGHIIDNVAVFDMHGKRKPADGSEYTSGGITEIRNSDAVYGAKAVTACLIPYKEEGFTENILGYNLADAIPQKESVPDYVDYLPSLSTISFRKDGQSFSLTKVTCENGVDAELGISTDPCFDSVIVIGDPDNETAIDKVVSIWDAGGIFKGIVRGNFLGKHPNMRFAGIGDGSDITLSPTFVIYKFENGTLTFEDYSGDLFIGDCILEEDGVYRHDPYCARCGTEYTMEASSSCGQTAEITHTPDPLPDMYITGDAFFGGFYSAVGGIGDIQWSIYSGGGSIDPDTGEADNTDSCGVVIVMATDECGRTATLETKGLTGSWFLTSQTMGVGDPYDGGFNCCGDVPERPDWCGFCDISNCYCGDYVYRSNIVRWNTCKYPAWLGVRVWCDGTESICSYNIYTWACEDPGCT